MKHTQAIHCFANQSRGRQFATWAMILLLVVLYLPVRATAALMAYEGFIYTAGDSLTNASAQGNSGSFGWGGRWYGAPNSFATNAATSLAYVDSMGNTLLTNGGSVVIGNVNGMTANAQPGRSFNFGNLSGNAYSGMTGPTNIWISFIMQWIGPVTANSTTNLFVRKGDLVFRAGIATNSPSGGTALYSVGSPNAGNRIGTPVDTWATWTGNDVAAGTQNTGLAAAGNSPLNALTFVLARIELNGNSGNDTVYTWFNWTNLTSEPPISTASLTNNSANQDGLNNLRLDANGGNASGTNTVLAFDEFRLGHAFADVTPLSAGAVPPPTISAEPQNVSVTATYPAEFAVSALGAVPFSYQWYYNTNILLTDATNATLTLGSVATNDAGGYSCVITNIGGSVTSRVAILTVLPAIPPTISSQPQPWTNAVGFDATFLVAASGSSPLHYQWYFNTNTLLAGQTNTLLSFTISSNDAGAYSVVVTNKFGSVTSSPAILTIVNVGPAQLPAFPGADGAGKLASGGRGGIVYHVTKLNSALNDPERASEGTFLYGLNNGNFPAGPRTIVFDVAGVFHLGLMDTATWTSGGNAWDSASRQGVSVNNLTIAGQTAPGPVIFMGGSLKPQGNNQIFRNFTIAAGYGMKSFWEPTDSPPSPPAQPGAFTMDAMDISGQNIMIDHIDGFYASDETISCNEFAKNITIQYCNCGQAQNYGSHGLGHLLQAGSDYKVSFIHNLDTHMEGRLPRVGSEVGTGAWNDFRNNVTYNWLAGTAGYSGGNQPSKDNFINNFYLAGHGGDVGTSTQDGGTGIFSGEVGLTFLYRSGNLKDTNKDGDPNDTASADGNYSSSELQTAAYNINIGVTLDAASSFTNVLRYVGSRWWERDYDIALGNTNAINSIGERLIHETVSVSGQVRAWADNPYNSDPNEGAEWRALWALRPDTNGLAPFNRPAGWDTDGDGMPNHWEIKHGLNPSAADNNGDFDNDYYSNLEEYLNEIAAWPAPGPILFTGDKDNRYAMIFNWRVNGTQVNIAGLGNATTYSYWQPIRYDTAVISNTTVIVDAVGQHAGTLQLTNNATLDITNGWLEASSLNIGSGCTLAVKPAGTLRLTGSGSITLAPGGTFTNAGTLDIMTWSGTLPPGFVNSGTVLDRSLIVISSYGLSGADFYATIQGYVGHTYQLQYRDDPTTGSWQNVGSSVNGTGAPINFTHTRGATATQRLYRIVVN